MFLVLNQLEIQSDGELFAHQLYLFWHPRFVVSFHNSPKDFFAPLIRQRRCEPSSSPWAMPELKWYFGYPAAWLLFIVIGIQIVKRRQGP